MQLHAVVMLLFALGGQCSSIGLELQNQDNKAIKEQFKQPLVSIAEFGAIGDGVTLNTKAFEKAIASFEDVNKGGTLYIPQGSWLTGCFNLTSYMTLFFDEGAVLLGSQDITQWPVIDPLPSYGRGRELPGRRYTSLIHGEGLTDVTITGNNGTIDGQGAVWWSWFHKKSLKHSRGFLVEFINSSNILLSNVTLANSPSWTVHPVYCSNVVVRGVTILAPHSSPNTDGINPDSSSNVCIQDCYISNGDDAIAIKSGWDEYGIAFGRPSTDITISDITVDGSHGISIGSEMSGGISNVQVKDAVISNSAKQAIHIKTARGRGGYIENISFSNIAIRNVTTAFAFTALYGDHADDGYDPNAFSRVEKIVIKNVVGEGVSKAGKFLGVFQSPFESICFANISLDRKARWSCSNISGFSEDVFPEPCAELQILKNDSACSFSLPEASCKM